ncbi:carboxypeptidase-like regulatory domain-containing protein [Roseivirga sp.]|uniref:carboxypeptidase-like regulatory domain-containing protein n=1 Tax=Roseivirga sp. TaxID=1964215 RepID=UPI003B52733C
MKFVLIIFFFLASSLMVQAQTERLSGKVVDAETGFPVPYASVLVSNKGQGIGASVDGRFQFRVEKGDTLQISSIGFETLSIALNFDEIDFSETVIFKLKPAAYELDSIQVIQLTDNFYLKRPKFDTLDIGIRIPKNVTDWNEIQVDPVVKNGEIGFVISGVFNDFDKRIQQSRIINEYKKSKEFQDKRQAEREKYFNKKLVKRVTRIDDRVIDEFMEFCNFLDGQIIGKSEYEITKLILEKYKAFLRR